MRYATIVAAVLVACAPGAGGPAGGPSSPAATPSSRANDRVLLTDFGNVTGIATSSRLVFAATPRGLAILDRQLDRWLPPLTSVADFPLGRVSALAGDPVEDAVWIGSTGTLLYYRPTLDYLTSVIIPGEVDAIMFDRGNPGAGAYVRAAGEWSLASRTGSITPLMPGALPPPGARITPPTLRDLYRQFPALQSFGGLLTRDDELRSWPVSAGAQVPDRTELWLGTAGNGIYRVDPLFNQSEHFPFGLLDPGAGALALDTNGIWVAGLGADARARGGVTLASEDLQRWRWLEGARTRPLARARAYALAVEEGGTAWIATDRGVVSLATRGQHSQEWTLANGLPADEAFSLAPMAVGVWVGTARGLVFIRHDARVRSALGASVSAPVAAGTPIRALLLTGDTLWIGSDAGLLLLSPAAPESRLRRPSASTDSRLSRPIRALAHGDSVVAIATADELLLLDLSSGQVRPGAATPDVRALAGITAVAVDGRAIWLTGAGGVMALSRATGVSRRLRAPGDIPGAAYSVRLSSEYAWIATQAGLLRVRRSPDGTMP